jgi:hypothetical protein
MTGVHAMRTWFRQLDDILRGEATRPVQLREGQITTAIGGLTVVIVLLGVIYGLCMGSFGLFRGGGEAWKQLVASGIKLPLLFLLTLAVTFPSLYVFNALIGSRLTVISTLRLLIAALGVILAVLASLGPIVVFFAVSTTSYPFMLVLNVTMCTVAGILGLAFLLRTLHRLVLVLDDVEAREPGSYPRVESPEGTGQTAPDVSGALDRVGKQTHRRAKNVFRIWTLVFALVGAQMSWVLRPFIGSPHLAFTWFRERESNFFLAVLRAIHSLVTS